MLSPVLTRTRRDESGGESWTEGRGRELQLSAFSFHYYLAVFLSFGLRCSPLSKNIHQTTVKGMFQNVGHIQVAAEASSNFSFALKFQASGETRQIS